MTTKGLMEEPGNRFRVIIAKNEKSLLYNQQVDR